MEIILSDEKISEYFNDGQIQAYMKEHNLTRIDSFFYLWFFNYAHVRMNDFSKDCGRPMFVKFAKAIGNAINSTQKEMNNADKRRK